MPYHVHHTIQIMMAVCVDNERLPLPDTVPSEMAELPEIIRACWQANPADRPTFEVVVQWLSRDSS